MNALRSGVVKTVSLDRERDIASARYAVSKVCDELGARALRKVRFVTAVSEVARNCVDHGGGGWLDIEILRKPTRIGVRCIDEGAGIPNIEDAMRDGFTTAGSMGKGLGGARRLVDIFEISNRPSGGLEVRLVSAL